MREYIEISDLLGKTMTSVVLCPENRSITFTTGTGEVFIMDHERDCCEDVCIESITGDLQDLVGSPLLKAEEASSGEDPEGYVSPYKYRDSFTWTFYKLATIKGYVDIRWLGESNGYYSESVNISRVA